LCKRAVIPCTNEKREEQRNELACRALLLLRYWFKNNKNNYIIPVNFQYFLSSHSFHILTCQVITNRRKKRQKSHKSLLVLLDTLVFCMSYVSPALICSRKSSVCLKSQWSEVVECWLSENSLRRKTKQFFFLSSKNQRINIEVQWKTHVASSVWK
jgi:hypothetical protein